MATVFTIFAMIVLHNCIIFAPIGAIFLTRKRRSCSVYCNNVYTSSPHFVVHTSCNSSVTQCVFASGAVGEVVSCEFPPTRGSRGW